MDLFGAIWDYLGMFKASTNLNSFIKSLIQAPS